MDRPHVTGRESEFPKPSDDSADALQGKSVPKWSGDIRMSFVNAPMDEIQYGRHSILPSKFALDNSQCAAATYRFATGSIFGLNFGNLAWDLPLVLPCL